MHTWRKTAPTQQTHVPYRPAPSLIQQTLSRREEIEAVRTNNRVEQVIGRYVELRSARRRLVGRCPFHEDGSPSLVVYPGSQSWFCFACDVGGDVFSFIKRIENVSLGEALRGLGSGTRNPRGTTGIPSSATTRPASAAFPEHVRFAQCKLRERLELTEEHFTLLTAATEVYHAAIFAQPAILEYLAKRRIDLDMIRRHRIGYATGDNLARYFRFRGWNPEIASDLGLIRPRGEYFRRRIVIPELRDGKAIHLVGRATKKYQKAKYLGLPGAPKPLYGAELIRGASEVLIAEGAFDWLTLIEWGYPAIALLGSHLKRDQVGEIANAERIFIATDSDEAGRKSAHQLAEILGRRARIVPPLPHAKDVNELATRPRAREIFARLVQMTRSRTR